MCRPGHLEKEGGVYREEEGGRRKVGREKEGDEQDSVLMLD